MNKAESTTHCGIGMVSELIKWELVWDGQWAEGVLSPDALTASFPAKNQNPLGPTVLASATEVKRERKRQQSCRWNGGAQGKRQLKFYISTHEQRAAPGLQEQL